MARMTKPISFWPMLIYVLTLDGVFDTGLAALQDCFAVADHISRSEDGGFGGISVVRVGVGGEVRTAHGLNVPVCPASDLKPPDVVVVAALGAKTPEALSEIFERQDVARATQLLWRWKKAGATIAAACTGTFLLAEAGILDGKVSTTSWWLGPFFRSRYPAIELDDSRMLISSGNVITAGAALAHFDLALWIIRRSSPSVASLAARYLIAEPGFSQSKYVIPNHLAINDPLVERFDAWARTNLSSGLSLQAAAKAIGASPRTLARRTKHVLGKTPLAHIQSLRIERAVHLLQTTKDSTETIATTVGYKDSVTLRTLLRRKLGRSAGDIRKLKI